MPVQYNPYAGSTGDDDKKKKKKRRREGNEEWYQDAGEVGFEAYARLNDKTPDQLARDITKAPTEWQFEQVERSFTDDVYREYGSYKGLADPVEAGLMWQSWVKSRNFNYWNKKWPVQMGPSTILAGVSLSELESLATSQVFSWVFQTYGSEYATVALQNSLIEDPKQRAETWRVIEAIAQRPMPFTGSGQFGGATSETTIQGKFVNTARDDVGYTPPNAAEVIAKILSDPNAFDEMSPEEQRQAIQIAQGAVQRQEEYEALLRDGSLADEIVQSRDVLMRRRGWNIVLSDDEKAQLKELIPGLERTEDGTYKNTSLFTTDIALDDQNLGLTHYREPGETPTFTFDPEWVKANFSKHAGVVAYLRNLYPNARFQYGTGGAIMDAFTLLDRGTDDVSSVFGGLFSQAQELGESIGSALDPGKRENFRAAADALREQIERGDIAQKDLPRAISKMLKYEDYADSSLGIDGYIADVNKWSNPIQMGTGFGDAMTHSLGIMPGDGLYDGLHMAFTAVGQIAFDPSIVLGKPLKALTLARRLPQGAQISRSLITQTLFDMTAKTPWEFFSGKAGQRMLDAVVETASKFDDAAALGTKLHDVLGVDMQTAQWLAKNAKKGKAQLHAAFLDAMTGTGSRSFREAAFAPKIDEVAKSLQAIDETLPTRLKQVTGKIYRRRAKIRKTATTTQPTEARAVTVEEQRIQGWWDEENPPAGDLGVYRMAKQYVEETGDDWIYHGTRPDLQDGIDRGGVRTPEDMGRALSDEEVDDLDVPFMNDAVYFGSYERARDFAGPDGIIYRTRLSDLEGRIFDVVDEGDGQWDFVVTGSVEPEFLRPYREPTPPKVVPASKEQLQTPDRNLDLTELVPGAPETDADGFIYHITSPENFRGIVRDRRIKAIDIYKDVDVDALGVPEVFRGPRAFFASSVERALKLGRKGGSEQIVMRFRGKDFSDAIPEKSWTGSQFFRHDVDIVGGEYLGADDAWHPLAELYAGKADEVADATVKTPADLYLEDPELVALEAERTALKDQIQVGLSQRDELVHQKAYWESVAEGGFEPVIPLREFPRARSIAKLGVYKTRWGKVWETASEHARAVPAALFGKDPQTILAYYRANPKIANISARFQRALKYSFANTGTGQRLWFETSVLPEGSLADEAVDRSYRTLRDFGRFLGTPDEVIDNMLTNMAKASETNSRTQLYRAFVNGYEDLIKNSSRLSDLGKRQLQDMWPELIGDRSAGMIRTGAKTWTKSEPTLWVPLVDDGAAAGAPIKGKVGVPIVEADMIQGFTLPTYEQIKDHVSMFRSWLKSIEEAGKFGSSRAASWYFHAGHMWRTFNAVWSRAVLLARMPAALPLRIQMEQAIRIEAFGFSSLVKHPLEWWKSVRSLDDFALIADPAADALGVMVRDYLSEQGPGRSGRKVLSMLGGEMEKQQLIRAIAGRIKAYAASPSTRVFLNKKLTHKAVVEKLQADEFYWATFGPHWDEIIAEHVAKGGPLTSYEKIVKNIRLEMHQLIQDDPELLRAARTGKMLVSNDSIVRVLGKKHIDTATGKVLHDDPYVLADHLWERYKRGEWKPDVFEFPAHYADYLAMGDRTKQTIARRVSDLMFEKFYQNPDLRFSRRPLFRQIASREYDRLRRIGFSEKRAQEAARVYGARRTADIMFTIGANSSADYFLRSMMPFFPAWKELSETWLLKIPKEISGGGTPLHWATGLLATGRKVDGYLDLIKSTGIIENDNGVWRVKVPLLHNVLNAITGGSWDGVSFSAESLASLFPTPALSEDEPFYKGMLPTLGAPAGTVLHAMSDHIKALDWVEDTFTLYGGQQSLGPAGIDYFLNSMGWTPPWQGLASQEMSEYRRNWAYVDAVRVAYAEHYGEKPDQADYKDTKEGRRNYARDSAEWMNEIHEEAERASTRYYLVRGLSSFIMPVSLRYSDDASQEMNAIWNVFSGIREAVGEDDPTAYALLEGMNQSHPELGLYLTGKSIKLTADKDGADGFEAFEEEMLYGKRLGFTDKEWLVWAAGQQELAMHRARVDEIMSQYGSTPQEYLTSSFKHSKLRRAEENRWEAYLAHSEEMARLMGVTDREGRPSSFASLYDRFNREKAANYYKTTAISKTLEQQKATEALDALDQLATFFGANQHTDDEYLAVRRTLNEVAELDYESKDPVFKAVNWYWDRVRPYFDEKAKIWDKINALPEAERAPYYQQLQVLENEWAKKPMTNRSWGKFPKVQEVMFARLSPPARTVQLASWAKLPVHYLSEFQRQKVYGKSKKDPQLNELALRMSENRMWYQNIINVNAIHPQSSEGEALEARMNAMNAQAAKELGVAKEYNSWQTLPYQRVSEVVDDPFWGDVVRRVDEGRRSLEARDISPRGSTPEAVSYQRGIIRHIEELRAKSPRFNALMNKLEIAYGEGADKPAVGIDLYWVLFFDGFPGYTPGYLSVY